MQTNVPSSARIKGAIVAASTALATLLLLFSNVFTYTELDYSLSVGFPGWEIAWRFLTGGLEKSVQIGKMKPFTLMLPTIPSAVATAGILLAAALTVWTVVRCVVRGKDAKGVVWPLLGVSLIIFVGYIFSIFSTSLRAIDRSGDDIAFFQAYDPSVFILLSALLLFFALSVAYWLKLDRVPMVRRFWFCYLLLVLPTICMLAFNFYPIFLQCIIAFKDYRMSEGIWGSDWVGLQYFQKIFSDPEIQHVIFTSIRLSLCRMTVSILPPLALAVFLFDMGMARYRKVVQTIVYIPHFFSWVIIYGVFYALLSNDGVINHILKSITGDGNYYVDFLTNKNLIVPLLLISQVWKEIGWGTILYLAALSNVDATLYEASALDGAGPMQRLFHITLPSIMSVIVFLSLMQIGSILSNGLDQILLFANLAVRDQVNTIELWVYQNGIGKLDYGLASAMGFFQSLIGLIMVLLCNKLSMKTAGRGLF